MVSPENRHKIQFNLLKIGESDENKDQAYYFAVHICR